MFFIVFSSVCGVSLMAFVSVQSVAMVSALMAVNGCLAAGFSGFTWFSHFIFLSFLGGLLVLFLYSTALAPCPVYLTRTHPDFRRKHVIWYLFCMVVFWVAVSGVGFEKMNPKVIYNEMVGVYGDYSWFSGIEMIDFSWLGGWFLPGLGLVLLLCMVCVTKLCSKVTVSLRRVISGYERELLKRNKKKPVRRAGYRETSLGRLTYFYRSVDEIPLYRQGDKARKPRHR